jgi:arylsulfatase
MVYSADDGCDVGVDGGAPVAQDYPAGDNAFNGRVVGVQLSIDPNVPPDHKVTVEQVLALAMARQ